MNHKSISAGPIRNRSLTALQDAFLRHRPSVVLDDKGYASDFRDILLPMVSVEDFEADLSAGIPFSEFVSPFEYQEPSA